MTEQEVRDLCAPLGVTELKRVYQNGWEVFTASNYRTVGRFFFENDLLDRVGASGSGDNVTFYLDHPPWAGQVPKSWLPKAAVAQDNYYPEVVECKRALVAAGFDVSYLRSGCEEGVKVKDGRVPFNLSFVSEGEGLEARFLVGGAAFRNTHTYKKVTVEQAVTLTQRSAALLDSL